MKKSLVALAVLGTLAGTAAAQSSVTLFGVVDLAARYNKANGQSISSLASSGSSSSRFGLRGTEELGGGLKAGFWIESSLGADTGSAGATADGVTRFWDRRATVSLWGDFGEARLGRAKTSERLVIDDFDPHSTTGIGDITRVYSVLGSGAQNINRSDNQVVYNLPANLGGFYGGADVAAGEGTDGKKYYGGRLGYKAGPMHFAGGYQQTDARGSKFKLGSLAGAYDFGMVRASLLYTKTKFNAADQDIYTVGAIVPIGSGEFKASYTNASANSAANAVGVYDAQHFALSYTYNLSKRTALYTTAAIIENDGRGTFSLAGSPTMAPGGRSGAVDVGVKHSF
ncbi:porin [Roseateles violae]|uniref:Porin n=1 Tax=Roseateles violae TaxID=3058042 RepID=A0ABT8DSV7_9BURK|nr:porin [Pelomonas sp. PFR6]MDN3921141.1 porin [Pelomonas sp. PFR6]